jgi:rubrerythrin
MGIFFSGSELINIGIGIERNGAAFYESLADSTNDAGLGKIYTLLAVKEREHLEIFQNMLGASGDYQPPETLTEEYGAYLRALVDSLIFPDDGAARDMAQNAGSDIEAIDIALRVEKDSILFYMEMRDLVRSSDRNVVCKLRGRPANVGQKRGREIPVQHMRQ